MEVDLEHPNYAHLVGHKVENRILLPATGYLELAWAQLCMNTGVSNEQMPIVFTNVVLKRATILNEQRHSKLFSTLVTSSGNFQFENEGDVVVSGNIKRLPEGEQAPTEMPPVPESAYLPLDKHDAYKEFRLRGYNYTGAFQGIEKISNEGECEHVTISRFICLEFCQFSFRTVGGYCMDGQLDELPGYHATNFTSVHNFKEFGRSH